MLVYSRYWGKWFDSETGEELDYLPAVTSERNRLGRKKELVYPKNDAYDKVQIGNVTFESLQNCEKERKFTDEEVIFINYLVQKEGNRLKYDEPNLNAEAHLRKMMDYEINLMKEFYAE